MVPAIPDEREAFALEKWRASETKKEELDD